MTRHAFILTAIGALSLAAVLAHRLAAQPQKEVVAPLPRPTGSSAVGTTIVYLADTARHDSEFTNGRPITVQLWYPASAAQPTAPYLVERGLLASMLRNDYYGIDTTALRAWGRLATHAHLDAAPTGTLHPLVAFSVGLGVARANYSSIAEELASYGYVVALVESPLQGYMVLPNDREVSDTAGRYGNAATHREGVTDWAKDITFTLDALQSRRVSPAARRVAASIDWARVGAAGHSSGGLVAIETCERDTRVRACVDLDGGMASPEQEPLAEFVSRGVSKPTLILRAEPLYDDTTFARRGMTREQWIERNKGGQVALVELAARSKGPLRMARIAGTGHFSFTDAPFVMPSAIARFGGRIIRPERGWTIITTVLRTYFDHELTDRGDGLSSIAARFPELTVDPAAR